MYPKRRKKSLQSSVFSLQPNFGLWSLVFGLWSSVLPAQVHKDSSLITAWANNVSIQRGFINISDTSATDQGSNRASVGSPVNATGPADGSIISLGDGGIALYTLEEALSDKPGPDFAIFENGFKEKVPPYLWFLELAIVEVSSDGENYFAFPSISNTQTQTQVTTFGQLDQADIINLAGKYPALYGTPFDLDDLSKIPEVDIFSINHIRITDVVGSLNSDYGTRDTNGNMINDPFPTPFWTGGFDLDALAILGASSFVDSDKNTAIKINVYPNPVTRAQPFNVSLDGLITDQHSRIEIIDQRGSIIQQADSFNLRSIIKIPGIYFIQVRTHKTKIVRRLIVQ